jgi:hypothetical protein
MASTLESSLKLANGSMKTQPKSILKKSPRQAKKSTPVFFTGNEQSGAVANAAASANTSVSSMTDDTDSEHEDESSPFAAHHTHNQYDHVSIAEPAVAATAAEQYAKAEAHEFQDLFESRHTPMSLRSSKVSSRRSPARALRHRSRRHQSAVYVFHSREINAEIIKILLSSTESFVKNFVKALHARGHHGRTEADLFRLYRSQFIDELREFLVNTDGHQRTMEYANKLGASLSEPAMYKMADLRHEIAEHEKQKEHTLKSNHANDVVAVVPVIAPPVNPDMMSLYSCATSNSDPNLCGSLPTASYLDAFSKDLKLREILLLKNLRTASLKDSLQRQDSVTLSHEHLNQSQLRSMKERNKCIVNAASTTRKIVRFADSFGLDLERVRIITNNSFMEAFSHGHESEEDEGESDAAGGSASSSSMVSKPFLVLIPLFSLRKSDTQLIKLDNYIYDYENRLIKCMARVKNICFEKRVFARITFNHWKSSYDLDAFYVKSETVPAVSTVGSFAKSSKESFDYFGFCIVIPERTSLFNDNTNTSGSRTAMDDCIYRIEFALCFRENQRTDHWDNNAGENYKFQCFFNK